MWSPGWVDQTAGRPLLPLLQRRIPRPLADHSRGSSVQTPAVAASMHHDFLDGVRRHLPIHVD